MNASDIECWQLEAVTWPVTYRYTVRSLWGDSQQELSIDVPALANKPDETVAFGAMLWKLTVARATSVLSRLLMYETVTWRSLIPPFPTVPPTTPGMALGLPASREATPCLGLHSGHADDLAIKRLPIIGAPSAWVSEGLVTADGRRELTGLGHVLLAAGSGYALGGPVTLIHVHRGVIEPTPTNPRGVAIRRVTDLRVFWHTRPAPELSAGI